MEELADNHWRMVAQNMTEAFGFLMEHLLPAPISTPSPLRALYRSVR